MPNLFSNEIMTNCSGGKFKNVIANLKNAAKITGRRVAEASSKVSGSFSSIKNFTSNITGEISKAG
jgi:RNase P/RNase MRP subunit POP5